MYLKIDSHLQLFFRTLFQSVMKSWHLVKLWHFLLDQIKPSFVKVHFNRPENGSQRVTFTSDVTSDFRQQNNIRIELGLYLELQDVSNAFMNWNSKTPFYFLF